VTTALVFAGGGVTWGCGSDSIQSIGALWLNSVNLVIV